MHTDFTRICLVLTAAVSAVIAVLLCYFSDDIDLGKEGATVTSFLLMIVSAIMFTVAVLL